MAFGGFSGLPVPTGDLLASLHIGFRGCLDGSNEPGMAAGGGLIGEPGYDAVPTKRFTPSALAARYGSGENAGLRLPANVSRNTPTTEARGILPTNWESGDERMCSVLK